MEPSDHTSRLLQDIRDDQRAARQATEAMFRRFDARFAESRERSDARFAEMQAHSDSRFEIIETTLRDLAQQMVMLARAVKVALESQ